MVYIIHQMPTMLHLASKTSQTPIGAAFLPYILGLKPIMLGKSCSLELNFPRGGRANAHKVGY